jgi:hypothetical protein
MQARGAETLLDYVQRIQRESLARGHRFLSDEELAAWVEELRADDDRVERAYPHVVGGMPAPSRE